MTLALPQTHPDPDTTAAPRCRRALRHWPTLVLLALMAAIGFVLAGPVTDASAAPPSPGPAADANADEPSGLRKLNVRIKGVLYEVSYPQALDPHDPHYKRKLAGQIVAKRLLNQVGEGKIEVSGGLTQAVLGDILDYVHRSQRTLDNRRKHVTHLADDIARLKKEAATATTPSEQAKAAKRLRKAQKQYAITWRKYLEAKQSQPTDWDAEAKRLKAQLRNLEKKVKNPRLTEAARQDLQQRIDQARTAMSQAQAHRTPDQTPDTASDSVKTTHTPKTSPTEPKTGATKKITAPKGPRGGRGGTGISAVIGEQLGQVYAEQLNNEHEQLLKKATEDPALRERIIHDYQQIQDDGPLDTLVRAFDTSKGFTQGATREIGPKLTELQQMVDTTRKTAEQSNADPSYQQARVECGGYDTCVTERTRKLREDKAKEQRNTKTVQDDKKARNRDAQIADLKHSHRTDAEKQTTKSTVRSDVQEHGNQKGTKPRTANNENADRPSDKTSGADAVVKKARDTKVANMKA